MPRSAYWHIPKNSETLLKFRYTWAEVLQTFRAPLQALAAARAARVRALKPSDLAEKDYPPLKLLPCAWLHYGVEVRA